MKTLVEVSKPKTGARKSSSVKRKFREIPEKNNTAKAFKAKHLYEYGVPVKIICRELDIARSTLYHYITQQ